MYACGLYPEEPLSAMYAVLDLPLLWTEPADEEQDDADGEVREDDAQPDVRVERVHEREDRAGVP